MKKKVFGAVILAAIVSGSAWNISRSTSEATLSDVALANVEALASGESILDYRIYEVYVYSSTHWTCNVGGTSACPAPN
jgi:hypothetical protein